MIIQDFSFSSFDIKLKTPFINSSFVINSRKGFIIKITDENNFIGLGEANPLPGLSKETFEDIEIELNKLYYSIKNKALKKESFDISTELNGVAHLPSLLFGVEQAIISLLIKRGIRFSFIQRESYSSCRFGWNKIARRNS